MKKHAISPILTLTLTVVALNQLPGRVIGQPFYVEANVKWWSRSRDSARPIEGDFKKEVYKFAVAGDKWAMETYTDTPKGREVGYQLFDGENRYIVTDPLWVKDSLPTALVDTLPLPIRGQGVTVTLWWFFFSKEIANKKNPHVVNPSSMERGQVKTNLLMEVARRREGFPEEWRLFYEHEGKKFPTDHFEIHSWTNLQGSLVPRTFSRTNFNSWGVAGTYGFEKNGTVRAPSSNFDYRRDIENPRQVFKIQITNVAKARPQVFSIDRFSEQKFKVDDYRFGMKEDIVRYESGGGVPSKAEVAGKPAARAQAEMFERAAEAKRAPRYGLIALVGAVALALAGTLWWLKNKKIRKS